MWWTQRARVTHSQPGSCMDCYIARAYTSVPEPVIYSLLTAFADTGVEMDCLIPSRFSCSCNSPKSVRIYPERTAEVNGWDPGSSAASCYSISDTSSTSSSTESHAMEFRCRKYRGKQSTANRRFRLVCLNANSTRSYLIIFLAIFGVCEGPRIWLYTKGMLFT